MNSEIYDVSNEYINDDVLMKNKEKICSIKDKDPNKFDIWISVLVLVIFGIRTSDGALYLFNHVQSLYVPADQWLLEVIFKSITDRLGVTWTSKLESGVLSRFKRDAKYAIAEFNQANAINLKNGVFDLDSGKLLPHTPRNTLFTYCNEYEYNADARCDKFLEVLWHACCNDPELVRVMQEIFGYCLSTETKITSIFFFYGCGANSKSLLTDFLSKIVGDAMVSNVSIEDLGERFGAEGLINKKLNISNESTHMTSVEKIKSITSGDRISIQRKYKTDYTAPLFCKVICVLNDLPSTNDVSHGFFRRVVIIPFKAIIQPENMDPNLHEKLLPELSGALNWCYEGYKRLRDNNFKLSYCKVVEDEVEAYKARENHTGMFFLETYERSDTYINENGKEVTPIIRRSDVYRDYVKWCSDCGEVAMTPQKFYKAIQLKASEKNAGFTWDERRHSVGQVICHYSRKQHD